MSTASTLRYLKESYARRKDWRENRALYPPGPTGFMAGIDAIRAFRFPDFAAKYYPEMIRTYGDIVLVPGPLGQFFAYVADPEAHYHISNEWRTFERAWLQRQFIPIAGEIIAGEGDEQKRRRKLINPSLARPILAKYELPIQEETRKVLQRLRQQDSRDGIAINLELIDLTAATSSRLLVGGAQMPQGLGRKIVQLIALFQQNPVGKKYRRLKKEIFAAVKELLHEAGERDLGILTIYHQEVVAGRMTENEAVAEVTGFFNASVETTANLLSWLIYELSRDPVRYQKLREEVLRVFNGRETISAREWESLRYTIACVEEALRLYPAVWRQLRQVSEPGQTITVKGQTYLLPYGTQLFSMVHAIQTDQRIWGEDHLKFNPEKHMDPAFRATLPDGAYAPFSQAIHMCAGKSFAELQAAMIMAHVARQCESLSFAQKLNKVFGPVLAFPADARLFVEWS